ncbi:MAG: hypothetical protein B6245_03350 [Desulfobacteraceae bacterium 4572_88]|nr:MAG: hypothetical protein B6245_03350 [Desulfobacteraceae bacterium 4572_88]
MLKKLMEKNKLKLTVVLLAAIVFVVGWLLPVKLEGEAPSVLLDLKFPAIGKSQKVSVSVSDKNSGIRKIWVGLLKGGKELVLFKEDYPAAGLFDTDKILEDEFDIQIEPQKLGITDGKGVLRVMASDFSWRRWWNGNKTVVEKEVVIDTRSPELDVLSSVHNISQGGSGLVIYRVSEPCPTNGVQVGDNFFPGYPARNVIALPQSSEASDTSEIFMAFIALRHDQGSDTDLFVKTADYAGNTASAGFRHYIRKRSFKKDIIKLSDNFLNRKMPEFDSGMAHESSATPMEKFLAINRELRAANYEKIVQVGEHTDSKLYWDGAFLRLPNSARKAGFADRREYQYDERVIDQQVHMGIDLASIPRAPVPAANAGKVSFVGDIGIYGKTVIIDHGFGLFSTYSHLSHASVEQGQMVSKKDVIGQTGKTGFVFGDHLHFGILVHNIFVDPVEWWDAAWIENNILSKMNEMKSQ